jgi:hypothetical protein
MENDKRLVNATNYMIPKVQIDFPHDAFSGNKIRVLLSTFRKRKQVRSFTCGGHNSILSASFC